MDLFGFGDLSGILSFIVCWLLYCSTIGLIFLLFLFCWLYCVRLDFGFESLLNFCFVIGTIVGDHVLSYLIYFVSCWIDFLPICYYVKINWKISELCWSFLFWYSDHSDSCRWFLYVFLFASYYHIVHYYYNHLKFFFGLCIPVVFFIKTVINIFCNRITKIGEFLYFYLF